MKNPIFSYPALTDLDGISFFPLSVRSWLFQRPSPGKQIPNNPYRMKIKSIVFALALPSTLAVADATTLADLLGGTSTTYGGVTFSNFYLTYSPSNNYIKDLGMAPVTFSMGVYNQPMIQFGMSFTTAIGSNKSFLADWGYTATTTAPNSVITAFLPSARYSYIKGKADRYVYSDFCKISSDGVTLSQQQLDNSEGYTVSLLRGLGQQSSVDCQMEISITTGVQSGPYTVEGRSNPSQTYFLAAVPDIAAVPEPTTLLSTLALVSSGLLLRRRGRISL